MDIQSAKEAIFAASLADDAVIMEGLHGIGKSQIVKQFSEEQGYHLEELFLSHQEVGDVIGIPHIIESGKNSLTTWSVPIWLQRMRDASKAGKKCVLFLDELNRAPIDVRQSALQLVLERKIHEHELPSIGTERTLIVAAINPSEEYQVDELDPALLDRFLHISIEADAPVWLKWARENNVNRVVADFIGEYPDRLHWTPGDGSIGASSRSWTKLGSYMDNVSKIPEEILFQVMKGKVGKELASQFYSFFKNYVDVIKIEDIEKLVSDNKDKYSKIEDLSEIIREKLSGTEAIQKSELAHQLATKYMVKEDILPFLAYLYALDIEICVSFLKSYGKDEPKKYAHLAEIDEKINDKNLFKRIVIAAGKN